MARLSEAGKCYGTTQCAAPVIVEGRVGSPWICSRGWSCDARSSACRPKGLGRCAPSAVVIRRLSAHEGTWSERPFRSRRGSERQEQGARKSAVVTE